VYTIGNVPKLRNPPNLKGITVKTTARLMIALAVTLAATAPAAAWWKRHHYAAPAMPMAPMMPMVPAVAGGGLSMQLSMSGDVSMGLLGGLMLRPLVERFASLAAGVGGLADPRIASVERLLGLGSPDMLIAMALVQRMEQRMDQRMNATDANVDQLVQDAAEAAGHRERLDQSQPGRRGSR